MSSASDRAMIYQRPVELLQNLIHFDTTNPPGNEEACIRYIQGLLDEAGLETTLLARSPERPNLITRLAGQGNAPPLLLYGHVDVVTTENQRWQHPPFEGKCIDGYVWGRGALDMKDGIAMMLAALLRAKAEGVTLPGDVILAVVCDEEADGVYGSKYLVENHAALFKGVRYAIGEGGGFALSMDGRKLYTIMVAEKQICSVRATVCGPGGHGSVPVRGGTMSRLADFLRRLERHRLPVHVTPAARQMFTAMSAVLPFPTNWVIRQLINPAWTDRLLDVMGAQGRLLDPLLHNTVNATIVQGGHKINVIPSEIVVQLDGRLLPGLCSEDLLSELRQITGDTVEFEVFRYDHGPKEPDMGLFDTLAGVLREADPVSIPIPHMLSAVTDARFFSQLGIQTYGFLPVDLTPELIDTVHAADERIPVEAVEFGTRAIYAALRRFGR
jgi:acetylornithine deacetylase/succinyl-diaminopimelate desuccinylase-like protein